MRRDIIRTYNLEVIMFLGFLKENGEYSYARVCGFVTLIYFLYASSIMLHRTGMLPDIPLGWMSILFIPYGINRGAEAMETIAKNKAAAEHKE